MTWTVVGGVGTLVAAWWAARVLGRALRGRSSWLLWVANALVLACAVGLALYSPAAGTWSDLVWGVALGLGFGGLAGLRNGWKGSPGLLHIDGVRPPSASDDAAHAPRGDAGFTMLESLSAAAILLIVAIGVIAALIATSSWYADARTRTDAAAVADRSMSVILARNYVFASFVPSGDATDADWPEAVPSSREETTARGVFTVETSMSPVTDPTTGVLMTRVVVTVFPTGRRLSPPVSITRYASGWQNNASGQKKILLPVEVQCSIAAAGIRVQLLDPNTLAEARYAVTDSTGLAVFDGVEERPDGYFLTADWRFGPNIRPIHFPERKIPFHGGTTDDPILVVNRYSLDVRQSAVPAVLRVGVYRHEGWRFQDGVPVTTPLPFSTIEGLRVYAQPVLNVGSPDTGLNGLGNLAHYPSSAQLALSGTPVWSGTVNAYGVAVIEIPYTTDTGAKQYWRVWTTTRSGGQDVRRDLTLDPIITGGWAAGVQNVSRPEMPSSGDYSSIPQWTFLTDSGIGTPDPSPPE